MAIRYSFSRTHSIPLGLDSEQCFKDLDISNTLVHPCSDSLPGSSIQEEEKTPQIHSGNLRCRHFYKGSLSVAIWPIDVSGTYAETLRNEVLHTKRSRTATVSASF